MHSIIRLEGVEVPKCRFSNWVNIAAGADKTGIVSNQAVKGELGPVSDSGLVGVAINVKIVSASGPAYSADWDSHFVSSVRLTHDSKLLVTGSYDYTVWLWELSSGKQIRTFQGHSEWSHIIGGDLRPQQMAGHGSDDHTARLGRWPAAGTAVLRVH